MNSCRINRAVLLRIMRGSSPIERRLLTQRSRNVKCNGCRRHVRRDSYQIRYSEAQRELVDEFKD